MDNYDNWKLENPYENEDKVNECKVCGTDCEDDFCSSKCYQIDLND